MPRVTVTATRSKAIAGRASRKMLVFRNASVGTTCYWGFEDTITAGTDANSGIPLLVGEQVVLQGDNPNVHRPVYFMTASSETSVFYTEN